MFKVWLNCVHFEWGYIGHTHTEEIYDIHCSYFQVYLRTKQNILLYWHAEYSHFWHTQMTLSSHHFWSYIFLLFHAMTYPLAYFVLFMKQSWQHILSWKPLEIKTKTDQTNRIIWKEPTGQIRRTRSDPSGRYRSANPDYNLEIWWL